VGDPVEPDWKFGVSAHLNYSQGYYETEEELVQAIDMIADSGMKAVRVDFLWPHIEPNEDIFQWEDYDRMVELIRERDLEIVGLAGFTPYWNSSDQEAPQYWIQPPLSSEEYGEFMSTLVARYDGDVSIWEIWGEPNISVAFAGTNPEEYFPLLQEGFVAAKYVNPEVIVLVGGLANGPQVTGIPGMEPEEFLQILYELGADEYSDGAAMHPYTDPHHGINTLVLRVAAVRDVMDAGGADNQLLWIGEIGYPTGIKFWSETLMANWLRQSYGTLTEMDGIGPIIWYNLRDKGTNPNDNEHHMGLVERNFEPKLTYRALVDYIKAANNITDD